MFKEIIIDISKIIKLETNEMELIKMKQLGKLWNELIYNKIYEFCAAFIFNIFNNRYEKNLIELTLRCKLKMVLKI